MTHVSGADYLTYAEYCTLIAAAEAELAAAREAGDRRRKNDALAEVRRLRDQCRARYGQEP